MIIELAWIGFFYQHKNLFDGSYLLLRTIKCQNEKEKTCNSLIQTLHLLLLNNMNKEFVPFWKTLF